MFVFILKINIFLFSFFLDEFLLSLKTFHGLSLSQKHGIKYEQFGPRYSRDVTKVSLLPYEESGVRKTAILQLYPF